MTLRLLLVGLGARSRVWRQVIATDPRARIVGVADIDAARAAAVGAELGLPTPPTSPPSRPAPRPTPSSS
jgi:predicted dehydrogenase